MTGSRCQALQLPTLRHWACDYAPNLCSELLAAGTDSQLGAARSRLLRRPGSQAGEFELLSPQDKN